MTRSTPPSSGEQPVTSGGVPVRVFVSYSHDSRTDKQRVFELAEQLRDDAIDCELDQYEESPPVGWARWMATQPQKAKFVLVVCTAPYHRRVTGTEQPHVGLG